MFVLLLLVPAVSVSACNFGDNNWALGCDFPGNDFKNLQIPGEQCGQACVDDARCTHFTWNTYKRGTCWLKEGQASDIVCNNDRSFVCGQIVHKNCKPNFGDQNWAFQCDFPGNDIRNVKVEASECGQACSDDARCTHFAWNKYDGCWLKDTKKLFTDAVCTRNPSDICGCVRDCEEAGETFKHCKPEFGDKSWALRCEFPGEGFKTVQVPASGCGPTCLWDTRCTHFSWTSANNGSCVLKSGRIAFSDAICTKDFDTVCGCERNCSRDNSLQKLAWNQEFKKSEDGLDIEILLDFGNGPKLYRIGYYQNDIPQAPCMTPGTKIQGQCRFLRHCVLEGFHADFDEFLQHARVCEDGYVS
ncbi:unnamed protein product [Cyprideis torosa]|uniref:Uncharacterized protein n=1 Tax=Cyprideis torosa TaxID=163714 RepID=A0A7R8ZTW4_9CRUS|nr:unnamed protein product [Cyprideis torosa]CAG0899079.1 unnamed protein product [Cyprideis torosa]